MHQSNWVKSVNQCRGLCYAMLHEKEEKKKKRGEGSTKARKREREKKHLRRKLKKWPKSAKKNKARG